MWYLIEIMLKSILRGSALLKCPQKVYILVRSSNLYSTAGKSSKSSMIIIVEIHWALCTYTWIFITLHERETGTLSIIFAQRAENYVQWAGIIKFCGTVVPLVCGLLQWWYAFKNYLPYTVELLRLLLTTVNKVPVSTTRLAECLIMSDTSCKLCGVQHSVMKRCTRCHATFYWFVLLNKFIRVLCVYVIYDSYFR
jgi:hypothetical protein